MIAEARIAGVGAVLVAGGKSRRMGADKRAIELDGRALIERVHDVLARLFPEIIVVGAEPAETLAALGSRVVYDEIPDCGTLGGLYTGLMHTVHPRVFAVGCDAPFLNAEVIRMIVDLDPEADVVMARLSTGLQPMHAVYSKHCLVPLQRMARSQHLKLQDLTTAPGLRVRLVEEPELRGLDRDLLSFMNLNTPADLEFARKRLVQARAEENRR